jgi:hypothetical protein
VAFACESVASQASALPSSSRNGRDPALQVLERLAGRFSFELLVLEAGQLPGAELRQALGRAHLLVGDLAGGCRRSDLLGLAAGCVVANAVGQRAALAQALRQAAGGEPVPFTYAPLPGLERLLAGLLASGPAALAEEGAANRLWMQAHWDFRRQWEESWLPMIDNLLMISYDWSPWQAHFLGALAGRGRPAKASEAVYG